MNDTIKALQLIILIIIGFLFCLLPFVLSNPIVNPVPCPNMSLEERYEAQKLHKYHGTLSSYEIGGEWYFKRNGIRCKLWNPERRLK